MCLSNSFILLCHVVMSSNTCNLQKKHVLTPALRGFKDVVCSLYCVSLQLMKPAIVLAKRLANNKCVCGW